MSEEFNAVNGNGEAFNPIVELLVREGHLTTQQAQYARRVGSRLHMSKPLCEVVRELGYVSDEQVRQTIRRNQGELRIGDLLNGLGYLTDEELNRALALQTAGGPSAEARGHPHPAQVSGRREADGDTGPATGPAGAGAHGQGAGPRTDGARTSGVL
jgi:hypothetical protein